MKINMQMCKAVSFYRLYNFNKKLEIILYKVYNKCILGVFACKFAYLYVDISVYMVVKMKDEGKNESRFTLSYYAF